MKYIRGYQNFKNNKKTPIEENYYYKKGLKTSKSILECALISEGISYDIVNLLNESVNFNKVDNQIVESIYQSLINNSDELELLEEGVFGNLIDGAKDLWSKGVEIGKTLFTSFKDFLSRIGDVIKTIFGKIKAFFIKLWEIFVPKALSIISGVSNSIKKKGKGHIGSLVSILGQSDTQSELMEADKDIQGVKARFTKGDMGNMSVDAEKHLSDEAPGYKDVTDTSEIEELIKDHFNFERKISVKKVYYSLKGYLLEGGNISDIYQSLNEGESFNVGDKVKYLSKSGENVVKEIIKVDGDTLTFVGKDGNEFNKNIADVTKVESETKDTGGVKGGKGMFGWIVEGVGFILSPLAKLKEWIIKAGSNGAIKMVSGIARRGVGNAYKYVVMGTLCGLVYHIIHAMNGVWGHLSVEHGTEHAGTGGHESKTKEEIIGSQVAKDTVKEVKGLKSKKEPEEELDKASYIYESTDSDSDSFKIPNLDPSKQESKLKGLIGDSFKILIPVTGGVLLKALGLFSPTLSLILEMILISIGVFELVGSVCELKPDFKDNPVCKMQHSAHHFLVG